MNVAQKTSTWNEIERWIARGRAECSHASRQLPGTPSCLEIIRKLERSGDGGAAVRARAVACHRCRTHLEARP